MLRCRPPTEEERVRLAPVRNEVTRRAGVDGSRYSLWIESAAGYVVAVTDGTLHTQHPRILQASNY
ncbi:hypothetical protein [Actinomadura pelletieri]|uniref:hypothetical protein n=1 Tax=Actinomadura pelletieri TaxID=111805 RepID=UPI000EAFD167|nr:hypothetical protein [Actinomadura pelletieri]